MQTHCAHLCVQLVRAKVRTRPEAKTNNGRHTKLLKNTKSNNRVDGQLSHRLMQIRFGFTWKVIDRQVAHTHTHTHTFVSESAFAPRHREVCVWWWWLKSQSKSALFCCSTNSAVHHTHTNLFFEWCGLGYKQTHTLVVATSSTNATGVYKFLFSHSVLRARDENPARVPWTGRRLDTKQSTRS